MRNASFIYRNLFIYRLVMNMLYSGGYRKRFNKIKILLETFKPLVVLELCFGDTYLASYCRKNHIQWKGIDINSVFVNSAIRKGYDARQADLVSLTTLPKADVCIMCGSLYHFNGNVQRLLQLILSSAPLFIISEPVKNLAAAKGIIGKIAQMLSNAGKGKESFRYDETSLIQMLNRECKILFFTYEIVGYFKKDILIAIKKNDTNT